MKRGMRTVGLVLLGALGAGMVVLAVALIIAWIVDDEATAMAEPKGPPHLPGIVSMCTEHGDRVYWREGWPEPFGVVGGGCR